MLLRSHVVTYMYPPATYSHQVSTEHGGEVELVWPLCGPRLLPVAWHLHLQVLDGLGSLGGRGPDRRWQCGATNATFFSSSPGDIFVADVGVWGRFEGREGLGSLFSAATLMPGTDV